MRRDVLIITPTRERRANAERLAETTAATIGGRTDLLLCIDDDDHSYDGAQLGNAIIVRGPRRTCIEWTNRIAADCASQYRAVASFGDDHEPETPDWDTRFLAALDRLPGPGIAYGDDTAQGARLPTAPVISAEIPVTLGWLMYPRLIHYRADDVWKALGQPNRLSYQPGVIIRHHHYAFGTAEKDATYTAAEPAWDPDLATYRRYVADPGGLAADRKKIRETRWH